MTSLDAVQRITTDTMLHIQKSRGVLFVRQSWVAIGNVSEERQSSPDGAKCSSLNRAKRKVQSLIKGIDEGLHKGRYTVASALSGLDHYTLGSKRPLSPSPICDSALVRFSVHPESRVGVSLRLDTPRKESSSKRSKSWRMIVQVVLGLWPLISVAKPALKLLTRLWPGYVRNRLRAPRQVRRHRPAQLDRAAAERSCVFCGESLRCFDP